MKTVLLILTIIISIFLLSSFVCFRLVFYAPKKKHDPNAVQVPEGKVYDVYREDMIRWVLDARKMPHEDLSIVSFDGLTLNGKFYEYAPGAPIELMFHGYRGSAERDLSGGVQRCFKVGRSALVVEQRGSQGSDGNVITFGIKEHRDCLDWIDFIVDKFGSDVRIILTGISMGASTVLMAAGRELPSNVIGVLADCGFNSAKDIMLAVMQQIGLPAKLLYPFIKLGARIFGHFDLESYSSEEAMKTCKVPVIFFHGEDDDFVPCRLSRINFDACSSMKRLVLVPGAGHGLCYPVAPDIYLNALREFFGEEASFQKEGLDAVF